MSLNVIYIFCTTTLEGGAARIRPTSHHYHGYLAAWLRYKASTMADRSEQQELEKISMKLNSLSFKKNQLNDRRNMLIVLQDYKSHVNYTSAGNSSAQQYEIDCIDAELREVAEKMKEMQEFYDELSQKRKKDVIHQSGSSVLPLSPEPYIILIEAPPMTPAPIVILDVTKLPPWPSQTQCPECRQFITTETVTSIGSVSCLVCVMLAMIGCLAGCCFLPFCTNHFKDVTHKCPKCRTCIHKITKL
ncbi:uncharacterized protein LOC134011047 isoform X1 [Osmerus eperlanus]|uniref:uncharacterized protein LOC134011047 isoform X1 n=2 Tax=Osmerus eperlanus TaxID=29151 RepID=UPI002E123DF1